jgi:hypothetical protein
MTFNKKTSSRPVLPGLEDSSGQGSRGLEAAL